MNILLIDPSKRAVYGAIASPSYPSISLGYIGAVLEKNGHKVSIIDIDADTLNDNDIVSIIKDLDPALVGLSTTTPVMNSALSVAKLAKKINPKIKTVLGGIHPTIAPESCIKHDSIDFIIKGEGENTILELVNFLETGNNELHKIDGIVFKQNKKIIINKERKLIENLDELPFPARHLFNNVKYSYPDALLSPAAPIITSRGCFGRCTYCCINQIYKRKFRARSAKNVVDEVESLINNNHAREIHIWDDNFTYDKKRVYEIRDEIKKRKISTLFAFPNGLRVDQVDDNILSALKEMGTYSIAFGVESGNQNILKSIKKGTTIKQIEKAFKLAKKHKIETWGFFMIGLPEDTNQTIRETIDFAKKIEPDIAKFHILKPYPGTEAFEQLSKLGLISSFNLDEYGIHTKPTHHLKSLSEEELLAWQKRAYREFYLRPSKIVKQLIRMKSWERIKMNVKVAISILKAIS